MTNTEKLSRARNAKDAKNTMNINTNPLSLRERGRGEGLHGQKRPHSALRATFPRRGKELFTAIAVALLFTAQPAQAQCTPAAPDPGPGADTVECVSSIAPEVYGATGTNGIVFDSSGNLTVNLTGTANTNLGAGGVSLTATGADDNLTLNRSGGSIGGNTNTAPALVNLQSQNGDISFTTNGGVSGNTANVQYAIRAQSSGAGDVNVTVRGGSISVGSSAANAGIAGILATSNGGDVTVIQDFNNFESSSSGANPGVTGRLYGIQASSTGTGNVSILALPRGTGSPNMVSAGNNNGIAAIDASTETGLLRIDTFGGVSNGNVNGGIGIRTTTQGGDAIINVLRGTVSAGGISSVANVAGGVSVLQLNMAGGTTTINTSTTDGLATGLGNSNQQARNTRLLHAVGSGNVVFNNEGSSAYGTFDLSSFNGSLTFNNAMARNGWSTLGLNRFSPGDDTINNTGSMVFGLQNVFSTGALIFNPILGGPNYNYVVQTTTLDFGGGNDIFNNAGMMVVGMNNLQNSSQVGATLEVLNLERFTNSGLLILGSRMNSGSVGDALVGLNRTDGVYDDVMVMRSGHYHGENGRIWIDALLNNTGQTSCARNGGDLNDVALVSGQHSAGYLRANDCLDFRGSAVSGRTGIIVSNTIDGDRGAYNPDGNVVVDVAGSDPAGIDPDAFFIAPENAGYNPLSGGVIDKGLFAYAMGYDAESQSFRLYGMESPSSLQFTLIGTAANDLWRSTTAPWFERQAQMREEGAEPAAGINTWLRGSAQSIDRGVLNRVAAGVNVLEFDNSYTQNNSSLTFGIDLGRQSVGTGYWNAGFMFGYARSRIGYDAFPNDANMEGVHAGFYGSFTAGNFFQNIALNGTWLELENTVPSLNLPGQTPMLTTDLSSLGGQLETGWTFHVSRVDIEPLLSVSWVKSKFGDLNVPADDPTRFGGHVSFGDTNSLRTGVGLRLAVKDVVSTVLPVDLSLTAKTMRESDGVARVTIENVGPIDALLSDTLDGTFNEVSGTVSLRNKAGSMSGYVTVQSVFADDYDNLGASAGFRLQW